jgi:hypothetical protein
MQTMRSIMTKRRPWKRKTERPNVVAVSVLDISYASPKGGRVPAYLTKNGVVSLLTDGPVAQPGYVKDDYPLSERQPAELIQQIINMCPGADLLLARRDVGPQRTAYVGHSYNATCY